MSELAIQQQPASAPQAQRGAMQAITPGQMISIALEKGADFAQLEKLMDMQERWERNEARKAFVKAKAGFKADCPPVTKNRHVRFENRTGGFTDYRHATLDHILDTVCPVMSEYGLSHSWKTEQKDGLIYVTCRLEHELGHAEETTLFGPPDTSGGKNQVQAIGSTTSFLERYTFTAITGIATGDLDDDGAGGAATNKASGAAQKQSEKPGPEPKQGLTDEQINQLREAAQNAGVDDAYVCSLAHVNHLKEIPASRFKAAVNRLNRIQRSTPQ